MSKTFVLRGLILVILFQMLVLIGEYLNSVYPLWVGTEIKLRTIPVDPRSMFRGNYARLNYTIDQVKIETEHLSRLRNHTLLYVQLEQDKDGLYQATRATLEPPDHGLYIRGHYQKHYSRNEKIKFGIEAFFAPKEKALKLEKDLRNGGIAVVMLAANGKAALKDVIAGPTVSNPAAN